MQNLPRCAMWSTIPTMTGGASRQFLLHKYLYTQGQHFCKGAHFRTSKGS